MAKGASNKSALLAAWLKDFIGKDKYTAYPEWSCGMEECSTQETIDLVNHALNNCAGELLRFCETNKPLGKAALRSIIKRHSDGDARYAIDTEDKEFFLEMFGLIAEACGLSWEESIAHIPDFSAEMKEINKAKREAEKMYFCCAECGKDYWIFVRLQAIEVKSKWLILSCPSCRNIDYKLLPADRKLETGDIYRYEMYFATVIAEYSTEEYSRETMIQLIELLSTGDDNI